MWAEFQITKSLRYLYNSNPMKLNNARDNCKVHSIDILEQIPKYIRLLIGENCAETSIRQPAS